MTTLSWLIYASYLSQSMVVFLNTMFIIFLGVFLLRMLFIVMRHEENDLLSYRVVHPHFLTLTVVFGVLMSMAMVMPDKTTIMTIASIEFADDAEILSRVKVLLDTYFPVSK